MLGFDTLVMSLDAVKTNRLRSVLTSKSKFFNFSPPTSNLKPNAFV